jgi:hypothetical protein
MEANRLSYFEYITFIISLNKNIGCLYVSRSIVNKLSVHRIFVRRIALCMNRLLLLLAVALRLAVASHTSLSLLSPLRIHMTFPFTEMCY